MILNLVKYLYFLLLYTFIFLLVGIYIFHNISLGNNFIFLFSLLVIPIVDIVIEKIKLGIKILLFATIILFCYIYIFSVVGNKDFIEPLLKYAYIFLITGAITQFVTQIANLKNKSTPLLKRKKGLEDYFNILYSFIGVLFFIGLFYEVIIFVFNDYRFWKLAGVFLVATLLFINSKVLKSHFKLGYNKKLDNLNYKNFLKYRKKINDNKLFDVMNHLNIRNDLVFYIIFLFFICLFLYGYMINLNSLLVLSYIFIFLGYIAFKIYGFKIETSIEKKDFKSNGFMFTLIFFTGLFALFAYLLLDGYVLNDYKNLYLCIAILLYFISFSYTFSKIDFKKSTLLGTKTLNNKNKNKTNYYNMLASIVIIILSAIIIIKNLSKDPDPLPISQQTIQDNNIQDSENDGLNSAKDITQIDAPKTKKKVKIGELYHFENYLSLYNESDDTKKLQQYMKMLGYYNQEITGKFDGYTQNSLKSILMYECHWPTTTKGVLGTNAAKCIESLEVELEE